jgi:hypothetical protein
MNLEQLNSILDRGEGQHTEFKSDFPKQAHDVAKSMVALSNSGGGILLLGIDDHGRPVGIKKTSEAEKPSNEIDRLANIARGCSPPLCPTIGSIHVTSDITVVYAELPHSPLSTYRGKVYIRVGATSRKANAEEIKKLIPPSNSESIQLDKNLAQSYRISKRKLESQAWKGCFISIFGIVLYVTLTIGLWRIKPDVVFSTWHIIILLAIMFSFLYLARPYLEDMRLYYKRPKKSQQSIFIGQGRLMEKEDESSYLIYSPTAPCIYNCCHEGKIVLADAPPREVPRLGKTCVGICSITGRDHSYTIDGILVATVRKDLDWRPLDRT